MTPRFRTGRKLGRTIYDGDALIGVMDTPELATMFVEAANASPAAAPAPWAEEDRPLPEDAAIEAAFPTRSGAHKTYAEAMRMVGAKRSKAALVALVNWLLTDRARLAAADRVVEAARVIVGKPLKNNVSLDDQIALSVAVADHDALSAGDEGEERS